MIALPRHRTVADVMTTQVHVAGPQTQFKVLVRLIEENRISAIPIVDQDGRPVGVVSESDLLAKERRTGIKNSWRRSADEAKAQGVVAADLMTSPPITVLATTALAAAARQMHERNVKRLIVVDGSGRITGVVSRSDLLQVFLRTDEELRTEVVERILPALVPDDQETVAVDVRSNVITLSGEVDRKTDLEILGRVTAELDGVVDVINLLAYRWDDTKLRAAL